jgi:hypothetical protein
VTEPIGESAWIVPRPASPLSGTEQFDGLGARVADFWRWAFSDLRDNTTRGILAEYLVARAVGDRRELRIGWDNFDVLAPDGTRIEVKCSAFLQSWNQRRHSNLSFGRLTGREFDAIRNEYSVDVRVRADVYVFAVQSQKDPAAYSMLDISAWQFWVVHAEAVRTQAGTAVGIAWVIRNGTGPLSHSELASAIHAAVQQRNDQL